MTDESIGLPTPRPMPCPRPPPIPWPSGVPEPSAMPAPSGMPRPSAAPIALASCGDSIRTVVSTHRAGGVDARGAGVRAWRGESGADGEIAGGGFVRDEVAGDGPALAWATNGGDGAGASDAGATRSMAMTCGGSVCTEGRPRTASTTTSASAPCTTNEPASADHRATPIVSPIRARIATHGS